MIRVLLDIADPNQRLILQAVLERAGHAVVEAQPDVAIFDDMAGAELSSASTPTLVLAGVNDVADAVRAMEHGVFGYIFVPFQPGEAALMVERAARGDAASPSFKPRPLADVEGEHIQAVLRDCNGNRSRAAKVLGIGRNTLWRKLAALENEAPDGGSNS